ncbi:ABC-2 family transporter protein [Apilactobacillus ozensis]|uniref:ABC-2 family transporter protein n=1 Tax=Apilactobacillus ozensis TaxID=866801 RepID=UPI00200A63A4|nr:ABC-2 family transporter protein [Apilactobacillus ozensis]MCK8607258.1 ABC transporter permease [Apilactobacillus ozensis]
MKFLRLAWRLSLQEFLAYRTTSILTFILATMFFSVEIITGLVYFSMENSVNGWQQVDYLLLVTTISNIVYLYNIFFIIGHENLSMKILGGQLDYDLIRPMNSYWYIVTNCIDIPSIFNLIISLVVSAFLLIQEHVHLLDIFVYILSIILGVGFIFLANQIAVSLSFWLDGFSALGGIIENTVNLFSLPMQIFPQIIQMIFTTIVPILLVTNLPVLLIQHAGSWNYLIYIIIFEVMLFYISKLVWRAGTKRYLSAN